MSLQKSAAGASPAPFCSGSKIGRASTVIEPRDSTGARQPDAIHLYKTAGYSPIPSYGHHADDPLAACFAKLLR